WQQIVGHDAVIEQLRSAAARGRMATSYLFVGPDGVGKRTTALALAKVMLCQATPEAELSACGHCPSCQQAAAGTHPDILQVAKPEDKSELPIALLIGDKEHRLREGLCYEVGLKPMLGRRKFAIIDDADHLNEEGANSLLKTLEEPPAGSVLILISTSLQRQLPTIRSRCQVMRFAPLPAERVAELLVTHGATENRELALAAARRGDGGLTSAIAALGSGFDEARRPLLAALCKQPLNIAEVEASLGNFAAGEGKSKQAGRAQSQQALQLCADFYRQWMRQLAGGVALEDAELADFAARAANQCRLDMDQVMQCLERVLEAMRQIDRNAYAKLWPLSLAADLAAVYAGHRITIADVA
ncbi:MAG: DNA polymerase III subunit, partial [Pirellulales bacterium]